MDTQEREKTMFFNVAVSKEQVMRWVDTQLGGVLPVAKDGIDVDIKPHKKKRSNQQNRFLSAIIVAQIRMFHETGFMADGLKPWMHQQEILRVYWKARYGIEHSSHLSTKAFGEFIDFIQKTLVEESFGNWQMLIPDSAYLKSLEDYYE